MRSAMICFAIALWSGPSCASPTGPSPPPPARSGGAVSNGCSAVPGVHDGQLVYKLVCEEQQSSQSSGPQRLKKRQSPLARK
jgi:hypothetical protein